LLYANAWLADDIESSTAIMRIPATVTGAIIGIKITELAQRSGREATGYWYRKKPSLPNRLDLFIDIRLAMKDLNV
jgi:hypothetical protein